MPITKCLNCGSNYQWDWEEAFDKFGFGDGDGQIETYRVQEVLQSAGYEVESDQWGLHNIVIDSIKKNGLELMPDEDARMARMSKGNALRSMTSLANRNPTAV